MLSTKSALFLLPILATFSTSARAESAAPPAQCNVTAGYLNGGSIPANAPAIPLFNRSSGGAATVKTASVGGVSLVGEIDPSSGGQGILLKASTPLAVNPAASLLLDTDCTVPYDLTPESLPVVIGPESPLPTTLGTVSVSGSRATITLTPEAKSYLAVTRINVSMGSKDVVVDPYQRAAYGVRTAPSGTLNVALGDNLTTIGQYGISNATLFSLVCGSIAGTPKPFHLTVSAHIAGAPSDPPALPLDMIADCVAPTTSSVPPPVPTTTQADAGTDDSVDDADEGCSMAKGGVHTDAWLLGVAGLALVMTGSRRRFRRRG